MATFVLIHGGGDVGWYWHLVEDALRRRGHDTVAPDLPSGDDRATLLDYADTVVEAVGDRRDLVVVAQSYGGLTAPIVADRLPVDLLVYVAAMVPAPGERPADWWANTGYPEAVERQAELDGGLSASDDPDVRFFHDVPPEVTAEGMSREQRNEPSTAWNDPWPLKAWPDVPTRFLLCRDDRLFPAAFMRRVVRERLGIVPDEIDGGHLPALANPRALVDRLEAYRAELGR